MRHGFSLVELSIVLVILGLLTGGILAGQSLIRAAELRSVSAGAQRYVSAVYSFRDKYMSLPGDMPNATRFWGAQHATPATCQTTASNSALTCDGNGDGAISLMYEHVRAIQHLANAGLVEGTYSGVPNPSSTYGVTPGINTLASKLPNAGFTLWTNLDASADIRRFANSNGTHYYFGIPGSNLVITEDGGLSGEELWNIDTKMDDGKPAYGKVMALHNSITQCTTTFVPNTAEYVVNLSEKLCSAIFKI